MGICLPDEKTVTNRELWLHFMIAQSAARAGLSKEDQVLNNRIRWLRIAYWTGAILDGLTCIPLLDADVWAALNHQPNFHATWDFRYSNAIAAAFTAAWTVLLIWADRKPLERRGVLPISIFLIAGLLSARHIAGIGGHAPVPFTPVGIVLPLAVSALCLFAYVHSFGRQQQSA